MPKSTSDLLDWYAIKPRETAVEPDLPIVDPHVHIFGSEKDTQYYQMKDYALDLAGGHNVVKTVYMEAYRSAWRTSGPDHLRSVGEVESIVHQSKEPLITKFGHCEFAAGIVASIDLTKGAEVIETLDAHVEAGQGRLRGVRQVAAYDNGLVGSFIKELPPAGLLDDPNFRTGIAKLKDYDLSFDVWIYHHQLDKFISLVDSFTDITFVLNHMGGLIGVGPYKENRGNAFASWKFNLRRLAERPNVYIKVGGLGMPVCGFNFDHQLHPATSHDLSNAWRPMIDTCIAAFGTKRCMFESNFPVDRQSAGYTEIWNAFKLTTTSLSTTERNHMFFETALRAYRLGM